MFGLHETYVVVCWAVIACGVMSVAVYGCALTLFGVLNGESASMASRVNTLSNVLIKKNEDGDGGRRPLRPD